MTKHWTTNRESQVLDLFRRRKPRIPYLASCRCPNDGRLLGAISRLYDGIWVWQAGSRLSPKGGHHEFRTQFLDCFDETEFSEEIYEQAQEYADEQLREWGGRLETDVTVMKVLLGRVDEPIRIFDRDSPDSRQGLPIVRVVTCGCRRHYLLPVFDLISMGVRADVGLVNPGAYIGPRPTRRFDKPTSVDRSPSDSAQAIGSFAADRR